MIGLSPPIAAPVPTPAKPYSVIGVSITRLRPEFVEQPLGDLVGALIFGDLLAHHEDAVVGAHLLGHGVAQRLAHGLLHHLGAGGHIRLVLRMRDRGDQVARRRLHLVRGDVAVNLGLLVAGLLDRRRRGGRGCRRRCRCILALGRHQRDHRADLHLVRALGHDDLA